MVKCAAECTSCSGELAELAERINKRNLIAGWRIHARLISAVLPRCRRPHLPDMWSYCFSLLTALIFKKSLYWIFVFIFFLFAAHIHTVYLQHLPPHTAYLGPGWLRHLQPNVPGWAEAPLSAALFMVVSSGSAGCLRMPHQLPPLCPEMPAHCPMPAPVPPRTFLANSPLSLYAGRARQQTTEQACMSGTVRTFS